MKAGSFAAIMVLALSAAIARAQDAPEQSIHVYFCQVAQPMIAQTERRVEIHPVTYAIRLAHPMPGIEIRYTAFPGPVSFEKSYDPDSIGESQVVNFNAASLLGLQIKVEKRPAGTWNAVPDTSAAARSGVKPLTNYYLDELKVSLDVSSLVKRRQHASEGRANREELAQFDALVEATVQCIIENARRSLPPIKKVRLQVTGWDRYAHWSDSYVVKPGTERIKFPY